MKVAMLNNCSFTLAQPLVAGDETFFVTGYVEGMNDDLVGQVFLTAAIEGAPVIECKLWNWDATAGTAEFGLEHAFSLDSGWTYWTIGTTHPWTGANIPAGTVLELRVSAEMLSMATSLKGLDDYSILIANETPSSLGVATDYVCIGNNSSPASSSIAIGDWIEAGGNSVSIGQGGISGYGKTEYVSIGQSTNADNNGVAVGSGAQAGNTGVSIGKAAVSTASAVAIGGQTTSMGNASVAVGISATCAGVNSVSVGQGAFADGEMAVAVGTYAGANGPGSIVMGKNARDAWGLGHAIVLGRNAEAKYASQAVVAGLFCLPVAAADGTSMGATDKLVRHRAVPMSAISSQVINLGTVAGAVQVDLPTGMRLYIDRIDVIQTATSTATTTPQISIGTSSTEKTSILAASDVTLSTQYARQSFTPATAAGVTSIYIDVPTAANAAKNVRVVFAGYLAA